MQSINNSLLTLIPARANSKRLPTKNKKLICGKPLIEWTILAAKAADLKNIVVSTDDTFILGLAEKYPEITFHKRPDHLALDHTATSEVVQAVTQQYGSEAKNLLLLQPSSPLRNSSHILEALEEFTSLPVGSSLISGYQVDDKYNWLSRENDQGNYEFLSKKNTPLFLPNGAIFLTSLKDFEGNFYERPYRIFKMQKNESVDIDTLEDFLKAETYLKTAINSILPE